MRMMRNRGGGWPFIVGLVCLGWIVVGQGISPADAQTKRKVNSKEAKALFLRECSVCHGPEGKADGPASDFLFPKPRDLAEGVLARRDLNDAVWPDRRQQLAGGPDLVDGQLLSP